MDEARRHAITASELLANAERFNERLQNMTPDERLQMIASGGITRANADLKYTIELATANALAAIALSTTREIVTEGVPA